jgi:chemotaxis protein MotB
MAGKGGGAWKVAYADFVTAMMAFFMVMWLVGQNDKMKEAVAEHFQHDPLEEFFGHESLDPEHKAGTGHGHDGRGRKKGDSDKKGNEAKIPSPTNNPHDPEDRKPRVLMVRDAQRSAIGALIPFDRHSATLTAEGEHRLNDLLPLIDGKPHKIEVRGHCSSAPLEKEGGSPDQFWQLAFARALVVQRYLESLDIPPERIRLSVAAQYEPFSLDDSHNLQTRNERVEVYLLNEVPKDARSAFSDQAQPSPSLRPAVFE